MATKPEGTGAWNGRAAREKIRTLEKEVSDLRHELYGAPGQQGGLKTLMLAVGENVVSVRRWQAAVVVLSVANLLLIGGIALSVRHAEDQIYLLKTQQAQMIELVKHFVKP